jgi:hypothetical protein
VLGHVPQGKLLGLWPATDSSRSWRQLDYTGATSFRGTPFPGASGGARSGIEVGWALKFLSATFVRFPTASGAFGFPRSTKAAQSQRSGSGQRKQGALICIPAHATGWSAQ